jgi:hypothetical protein
VQQLAGEGSFALLTGAPGTSEHAKEGAESPPPCALVAALEVSTRGLGATGHDVVDGAPMRLRHRRARGGEGVGREAAKYVRDLDHGEGAASEVAHQSIEIAQDATVGSDGWNWYPRKPSETMLLSPRACSAGRFGYAPGFGNPCLSVVFGLKSAYLMHCVMGRLEFDGVMTRLTGDGVWIGRHGRAFV